MEKATSRAKAKALGAPLYFTGNLCKNGHLSDRFTSNGSCLACNRETARAWAARNRNAARARCAIWKKDNPEKVRAYQSEWRENNREKAKLHSRKWIRENPERAREVARKSRIANRENRKERKRFWLQKNSEKVALYSAKRRASKIQRSPSWADEVAIRQVYAFAKLAEAVTGWPHHVDHIIPLQGKNVSGLHVEGNLQIIFDDDNLSKGNSWVT
jgi:hypothetical protein